MGLTLFGGDGGVQEQSEEGKWTFKVVPRPLNLDTHVEPGMELGWRKEDDESAPTCLVDVALTPEFSAYPQFHLEMPARANWVTIKGEADSGAQGCLIHPEVFNLFHIDAFEAPPTSFSGIVDDGGKLDIVGAAYLRVEHQHHPLLHKTDRQLFYIVSNMEKGVTLSLTCSQNLGIFPRKLEIARKDVEDSNLEERLAIAEERLAIAEERLAIAEERRQVALEQSYWKRMLDLVEEEEEEQGSDLKTE